MRAHPCVLPAALAAAAEPDVSPPGVCRAAAVYQIWRHRPHGGGQRRRGSACCTRTACQACRCTRGADGRAAACVGAPSSRRRTEEHGATPRGARVRSRCTPGRPAAATTGAAGAAGAAAARQLCGRRRCCRRAQAGICCGPQPAGARPRAWPSAGAGAGAAAACGRAPGGPGPRAVWPGPAAGRWAQPRPHGQRRHVPAAGAGQAGRPHSDGQ